MLRKFISLSLLVFAAASYAQVTNGGFESYVSIPTAMGQWQMANGWGNAGSAVASPDYYHYDGNVITDLPETPMAIVDPQQGDAVMGLVICGKPQTNIREYLSMELSEPLVPGERYMVGIKITNGVKTTTSISGLGVDQIGFNFTLDPMVQNGQSPLSATPQLKLDAIVYNENWQSVNFLFIPDQPYRHVTFGLFNDDSDKNIAIFEGNDPMYAYYFVDNFSIQEIGITEPVGGGKQPDDPEIPGGSNNGLVLEEPFFVPNTFTPNSDESNDVFKPVSNLVKDWQLEVFSKWGDRVFVTTDENTGWDGTFNGANCGNGSYVWQISYTEYDDTHQPRQVERRGIVNLLR